METQNLGYKSLREVKQEIYELAGPIALEVAQIEQQYPDGIRRTSQFGPDDASCSTDPDIFFPERGDYKTSLEARRECLKCPVVKLCMRAALFSAADYGIMGGMTYKERLGLLNQARETVASEKLAIVLDGTTEAA